MCNGKTELVSGLISVLIIISVFGSVLAKVVLLVSWFIGLFAIKMLQSKGKKNYLRCHGEEAQEKPPGL